VKKITRRDLFLAGTAGAAVLAGAKKAGAAALAGEPLVEAGRDVSPSTGKDRQAIPSACWQCVTRDAIIGYVEDGRLVKIEGNPKLPRTNGKLCSRGQGGIGQSYDPDRILYPMKHVGTERGDGKWKRISWEEALEELTARLKKLRDDGTPEKFMFHYGRMKASASKIIKSYFLPAYGTKTIGNHTSICEGGKWTAQELTWGKHYDVNDVTNTNFILNFGCNALATHTNHIPLAQRISEATAGRDVGMVTFDVRLSETAAKSREWIPIKPGTDLAVVLAMCNVLVSQDKVDTDFINTWTNVRVPALKKHLAGYTAEWAARVSGVPADKITALANEYFDNRPSTVLSYRGAVAHYNGVQCERAVMMLESIAGNIDVKGGRCKAVGAKWKSSFPTPSGSAGKVKVIDGDGSVAYPSHHISHQVLEQIKDGSHGSIDTYMMYCYNPAYVNGDCQQNIDILKDKSLIPYLVAVDVSYSESTALADLILPDAPYTERWDWEDHASMDQIPEFYIRQPLIEPLGECRDFKDVCCDLAKRLGFDLGFTSAEEFVKDACENTPGVKEAGGFEYMKQHGAWVDPDATPKYKSYAKELSKADLEGAIADKATGVYWTGEEGQDYTTTKDAYKKYVGQVAYDGKVYVGFKPDKLNKSGLLEIYSKLLKAKGLPGMPSWMAIPEHQDLGENELVLTTYKAPTQTHSRTQNCKYLTELFHRNVALINPASAGKLGVEDEDEIKIKSDLGEITIEAKVTEGIVPGVVAVSMHCGHWAYGRYASGEKAPLASDDDPDLDLIWWRDHGAHPNWLIPNAADPIGGQLRFMDTVVTVELA